jgi:hypothetical protein
MKRLRSFLLSLATAVAGWLALSCGASSISGLIRQPQSVTLSPATADALDYLDGQVQFTATGHYSTVPYTVTPQPATWGACDQNDPTTAVSVTMGGLAQCANGASGTYTIFAFDMTNCNAITACGGGCTVVGTAQLTCP